MIDFHTHILPGIDDGCRHVSESLKLLQAEKKRGVRTVVLTPHFYASDHSPEEFLSLREYCWERLRSEMTPDLPKLLLGAEVQYFEGMGSTELLPNLCVEGTDLLLLEMPFCRWDARMIRTVLELNESGRVRVILAHIDRYLRMQPGDVWDMFRSHGVLSQMNADFFDGWLDRRKAMAMLRKGQFQLLGSDCHNLKSRRPNWELIPDEAKTIGRENARTLLASYGYSL